LQQTGRRVILSPSAWLLFCDLSVLVTTIDLRRQPQPYRGATKPHADSRPRVEKFPLRAACGGDLGSRGQLTQIP